MRRETKALVAIALACAPGIALALASAPGEDVRLVYLVAAMLGAAALAAGGVAWRERARARRIDSEVDRALHDVSQDADQLPEPMAVSFEGRVAALAQSARAIAARNFDLTARGKALSYHNAQSLAVLEALPDGVIVFDDAGFATFANAKLEPLLGAAPATIVGKRVREWCTDDLLLDYLSRHLEPSAGGLAAPLELVSPADPQRRLGASFARLPGREGGAGSGAMLSVRDVSAEHNARRAREEFVAHLGHELKSPLGVITMYAELLQGPDAESKEMVVEAANAIRDSSDRMATLIGNLLSISKIEMGCVSLERSRVRLQDLLRDALEHVEQGARDAGVGFRIDVPESLGALSADKGLLQIAVTNLLTNAVKYNRRGGTVTLTAEQTDEHVVVRVRDTGLGIAAEALPHVFEKFYRAPDEQARSRGGHGLGLYIVKSIVDLHQGEIEVASETGVGTEFTLRLRNSEMLHAETL